MRKTQTYRGLPDPTPARTYDIKKWSAMTTEERSGIFRASVAHWNGENWMTIWTHSDLKNSRTAARNAAIKKIGELEASGFAREPEHDAVCMDCHGPDAPCITR